MEEQHKRLASATPLPETLPAFVSMVLDANDHLWFTSYDDGADDRNEALVYAPGGRWLGSVAIPSRLEVTDVGDDYVLGIHRGVDEVESIRLYTLQRS